MPEQDSWPEPIADACPRTLDEVPPFDTATARRIIEEHLGRPPGGGLQLLRRPIAVRRLHGTVEELGQLMDSYGANGVAD